MDLREALALIDKAVPLLPRPGQTQHWADLGCGSGLFTTAIARLLPAGSTVYGVDTNPTLPHSSSIIPIKADFEKDSLPLNNLDGIIMANSLHYVKDKPALLQKLRSYMQPQALFIIVEYDTDQPVPRWVPYPVSYVSLSKLFPHTQKLGERPSVYGRANMYAALAIPHPFPDNHL
ncbi:MAG: class I SAM-dependent methyltransferase [Chitinophagaceae bacterium]|nr:class I SAM-dependent methyltransferase [Chitinophagaceae bacterium]